MLHLTSLAVLITTLRVGIAANDLYFNSTVLLLNGDVIPFTADASINKFQLSPLGTPRANINNPFQAGYYSGLFNGSTDYLSVPSNAVYSFGTGDFTVECWIYSTSTYAVAPGNAIGGNYIAGAGNDDTYWVWGISATGTVYVSGRFTSLVSTSAVVPVNIWTHVAVSRQSGTSRAFINGILSGTSTTVVNFSSTATMYVGAVAPTAGFANWPGYISNFRVVKGIAVYTGSFTPSTAPLTATQSSSGNIAAITGTATSLLTLQSSRFINNSSIAQTITVGAGAPSISVTQPFALPTLYSGYGSGLFNGSTDYFTLGNSSLTVGTQACTVEAWIYMPPSGGGTLFCGSTTNTFQMDISSTDIGIANSYTAWQILTSTTIPVNQWVHVVFVRSGTGTNQCSFFINGTRVSNGTISYNFATTSYCIVGNRYFGTGLFTGYISNFKFTLGTAVYDPTLTSLTIPTAPFTAITGTSLLILQNNQAQNNNQFRDSSSSNFTITRSGTPTQGTFTPFSQTGWSGYFNGSGNMLTFTTGTFGSSDFTIEFWLYSTINTIQVLFENFRWYNGLTPGSLEIGYSGAAFFFLVYTGGGSDYNYAPAGSVNSADQTIAGRWIHLAVCRNGSTISISVNGVMTTSTLTSNTALNLASRTTYGIGGWYENAGGPAQWFSGYISNFRIVKGTALYTSNFTPPTAALTAVSGTSLLTLQGSIGKDNSITPVTISMGGVGIQSFSPFAPTAAYSATLVGGSMYFNGTSDFLTASGGINLAGSDWTIETWIYPISVPADNTNILQSQTGTNNWIPYLSIGLMLNGRINVTLNAANYTTTQTISFNTWNHLALVRSGGIVSFYINGVASSVAVTVDIINSNFSYWIGKIDNSPGGGTYIYYFPGYISNLRIVKGTAVYIGAFTPPTAPLTATVISVGNFDYLLVGGGGGGGADNASGGGGGGGGVRTGKINELNGSISIIVGAGGAASANGGTSNILGTSTNISASGGGGGAQFVVYNGGQVGQAGSSGGGGSGNYQSAYAGGAGILYQGNAGGSGIVFGSGSYKGGGGGGAGTVGGNATGSAAGNGGDGMISSITGVDVYYGGGGGGGAIQETQSTTGGAGGLGGGGIGVRTGGTTRTATPGTSGLGGGGGAGIGGTGGAGTVILRCLSTSPDALSVTGSPTITVSGGYRIYTWTTTGSITFSTFPSPTTTVLGQSSLLLSGTNTGIQDATGKNSLTTVGDARISTAVTKYGTGSMYFDGTGDYLTAPPSSAFAFNGDYTVEAWIYPNSFTTTPVIFDTRSSGASANGICVYFNTSGNIVGYINVAARITSATAYSTGLWYHVALVRSGTNNTLYVNGISVGIYTYGTALTDTWLTIGTTNDVRDATTTYKFNGYIDDLRITKYARYTTAFVPPSAALGLR